MKVIILCNSLLGGGAEKVAAETFSILKKDTELTVLVASTDSNSDLNLRKSKDKNLLTAFFNLKNFFTFFRYLLKEKPDVIHMQNYVSELTPSVLLSIRLFRVFYSVRVLQTLHDHHLTCPNSSLYNDKLKSRCMDCINSRKTNIIKNRCYQGSLPKSVFKYLRFIFISGFARNRKVIDVFLCPSNFIRDIALRDGIPKSQTLILRNPISEEFTKTGHSCMDNLNNQNVNILFLGRLVEIKSIETIIEALHICSSNNVNVSLDICGDGILFNSLEDLIISKGLKSKVILHGRLNTDEIRAVAEKSEILVLPSIVYENAPLVILEGISLNLFPIVSNIGGMLESIETLQFGSTFEAGNPESLAKAIVHYIDNRSRFNEEKIKAKEKVKELCSERKYLLNLLGAYKV